MGELVLRDLEERDRASFVQAVRDFSESDPDWEFAFQFDPGKDFSAYVERLRRQRRGQALPEGWVPHSFLVAVVGERVIGRLSLRHELNDFLRECGGHVGFGVIPSCRRRGYGVEILRQTLPLARSLGLDRLLLTCSDDNIGSRTIIERCGGVLEGTTQRFGGGLTRRYWIAL